MPAVRILRRAFPVLLAGSLLGPPAPAEEPRPQNHCTYELPMYGSRPGLSVSTTPGKLRWRSINAYEVWITDLNNVPVIPGDQPTEGKLEAPAGDYIIWARGAHGMVVGLWITIP